jgi:hypothetical protein
MKAYKLIFELLKHPFGDVVFSGVYKITHTMYNRYLKHHTIESLTDERVREECNKNKLSELKRPCENFKPKED